MDPDLTKNPPSTAHQPDYTNVIIDSLRWLQENSEYRHGHSTTEILEAVRLRRPDVDLDQLQSQIFTVLCNAVNDGLVREMAALNTLFKLSETPFQANGRTCRPCRSMSAESSSEPIYCHGCTHTPRCQLTRLPPFLRDDSVTDQSDEDNDLEDAQHPPAASTTCIPNTRVNTPFFRTREVATQEPDEGFNRRPEPPCPPHVHRCNHRQVCPRSHPPPPPPPPPPVTPSHPERVATCPCIPCGNTNTSCGHTNTSYSQWQGQSSEPARTCCNCAHCQRRRPRPPTPDFESPPSVCSHPKRSRPSTLNAHHIHRFSEGSRRHGQQTKTCRKHPCTNPTCPNYKKKTGECVIM